MSGTPLSDWTPIAYLQREEERRRNEQKSAGQAPLEHERCNSDEKHLSSTTVASLQRRFLLLEQRLTILEQREHERRIREKFEAVPTQPQTGTPHNAAAHLGGAVSAIRFQGEYHSQAKARPEFTYIEVEKAELIGDRKTRDLHDQSHATDSSHDERSRLAQDSVEIHPSRSGEPIREGLPLRIATAFSSFVATAFLASSVGFVGAILTVPPETAAQFHALVKMAVNTISR